MTEPHDRYSPSDPSSLTTASILREVESLGKVFDVRLDAMDKAMALFESNLTRFPTEVDKAISHQRDLVKETFKTVSEQFESIQKQFLERDTRTEQTGRDSKTAIDAAFASSAAAISKSEIATTKQIDQIVTLVQASNSAMDGKLNDVKERLTRIESMGMGRAANVTEGHASSADSRGYIQTGISVLMFLVTIAVLLSSRGGV